MAVRAFTAAHNLDCAVGALSTGTFGTIAAIVKRDSIGSWSTIYGVHASGGSTPRNQFAFNPANNILLWQDPNSNSSIGPLWSNTADWALFVVRKATGAGITPRFSLYNYTTGLWTHAAGTGSALENWATSPGGVVRFNWAGGDNFVGRIAARAAWNSLPWAADTGGDAAIEAAGLHTSAANWLTASPNAMWLFNQAAVTDAVTDVTGNGADQTSRTGTTVIAGDDPPGFDFSLVGGTDVDLTDTPTSLRLSGAGHVDTTIDTVLDDTPRGIRLSGPAELLNIEANVTITDRSHGLRLGGPDAIVSKDVIRSDTPSGMRLGGPAETVDAALSGDVTITDRAGALRLSGASETLAIDVLRSMGVGQIRLGGPGQTVMANPPGPLVFTDLHFIALAPEVAHGAALAPELLSRTALAPELGHGATDEPELAHGNAAAPALDHGDPDAPDTAHGHPLVEVGHGQPGEPEI